MPKPSLEQRTDLLASLEEFGRIFTSRWPQVDSTGKITYCIGGAFAFMLLMRSQAIESLEARSLPEICVREEKIITEPARRSLSSFARKISDIDLVRITGESIPHEKSSKYGAKWIDTRKLPRQVRNVLIAPRNRLLCDEVACLAPLEVSRLSIKGVKFFIERPSDVFGYKMFYMAAGNLRNDDFATLYKGLQSFYPAGVLISRTADIFKGFQTSRQDNQGAVNRMLEGVYANRRASDEVKEFFRQVEQEYQRAYSNHNGQ